MQLVLNLVAVKKRQGIRTSDRLPEFKLSYSNRNSRDLAGNVRGVILNSNIH